MSDRWCLASFPSPVWLTRRSSRGLPEGAEPIPAEVAAWQVEAWLDGTGLGRDLLAQLHDHLAGPLTDVRVLDLGHLRAVVRRGLSGGDLVAYRLREKLSGGPVANHLEEGPPSDPAPVAQKTWLGIELVDDADPPQPVAYAKYRVELPDGSTREGILDDKGRATLRDVDPGECQVSFPELHGPDWKAA